MQEIILMFACLNKTGCEETYKAYYVNNPSWVEVLKSNESKIKNLAKPYFVDRVAPVVSAIAGYEVVYNINKEVSIKYSNTNVGLNFKKEF